MPPVRCGILGARDRLVCKVCSEKGQTPFEVLGLDRALVVKQPWIGLILDGLKTWELRSKDTKIRGRIGLIESGTGKVFGEVNLKRVTHAPTSYRSRSLTRTLHRLDSKDFGLMDQWCFAWVLGDAVRYAEPIPYEHPVGAVVWVDLTKQKPGEAVA